MAATTAAELRAELVDVGTGLLVDVLAGDLGDPRAAGRRADVRGQDRRPTSGASTGRAPPSQIDRWVRVGGAWTTFRGERLGVVEAEPADGPSGLGVGELTGDGVVGTGAGALRLRVVRPAGKRAMPWRDFANGARPQPGERLGD